MRIARIELRHLKMPLKFRFETSFGTMTEKSFLLAQVFSDDGDWGLGECVAEEHPYYLPETNGTVAHIIREFLAPLILGHVFEEPTETDGLLSRIRGHEMAKAALEMAIWDLFARTRGEPLFKTLGGAAKETIPAGVSIGLQNDVPALLKRVAVEVAAGYQRIKIKIKPGADLDLARAVRKEFPSIPLMVDANSAYTLKDAEILERFDEFNLMMIEQPLAWNDIVEHSKLQPLLKTPICLDESITSNAAAESAISVGACGIINIKAGRVGGLLSSKRIQATCAAHRIPVWCGGMLESGIGRLANVHLQTLPGFTLPGDTSASARYFDEDLIEPGVGVDARGQIRVPDQPGLGHEIIWSRVERATIHRDAWSA
ncbi:MAG: o-succinylbenzoate synthase [Vicinamibacteria bacterium]|nr:o-succinylbenzoate synthase [Vicinamibacteria bacterium]